MNLRRVPPDKWLMLSTVCLVVIGVWLVYDASYVRTALSERCGYDPCYYLKRQGLFAIIGLIVMLGMSRVPYWWLRWLATPLWYLSLLLLALVFVPKLGAEANNATRWLKLPFGVTLQPSEMTKLALVLFMARRASQWRDKTFHPRGPLRELVIGLGLSCLLIALEPDLGTAMVIAGTWGAVAIAAGIPARTAVQLFLVGMLCVGIACARSDERRGRLVAFLDPWKYRQGDGYQLVQSFAALGSGGAFGVGPAKGVQKCFYIPEPHTDFILSTLGEEVGFLGCVSVVALFGLLVSRGMAVARRAKDPFAALVAIGISSCVGIQAGLNMAVVSGMAPTTGVPLPFISYGGSSLVVMLASVGILLNISKYPDAVVEESSAGRSVGRWNRRARVSGTRGGATASQAGPRGSVRWY